MNISTVVKAAFAVLILAPLASADWLERGVIAASVADLSSTEYGLRHCSGCYEGNPIMGSTAARIGFKTAASVLVIEGTRKLRPTHPKLAKGLKIGIIVLYGAATIHNLRMAHR